jgi:hypothetical protein
VGSDNAWDMIPFIKMFLEERSEYLKSRELETPFLFSNPDILRPYRTNTIRRIKKQIGEETGIDF